MSKSQVYSWRLTPELKARLEAAAKAERATIGALLERIAWDWLLENQPAMTPSQIEARRRTIDDIVRRAREADPDPEGPPTPSATNENIRKAFRSRLKDRERRRRAAG